MWLLVLITLGGAPTLVQVVETGHECRARAIQLNDPRPPASKPPPDPSKRYACFALDSIT